MARYVPIIDGCRSQFERLPVETAAKRLAQAYRDGKTIDARVSTGGAGYRVMTQGEAGRLMNLIAHELAPVQADGQALSALGYELPEEETDENG